MSILLWAKRNIYLTIIILNFGIVFAATFEPRLFPNGDNCYYLMAAKAFVNGHGFTDMVEAERTPIRWWPLGFPLFLSLCY
ncbi:MAG: hypothetical protein ABIA63_01035, partial [bacterium]